MTYDQDSKALVTVSLATAMETYACSNSVTYEHLNVLSAAVKDAHSAYMRAAKKSDYDAMLGAASRLELYSDKLHAFTKKLATIR